MTAKSIIEAVAEKYGITVSAIRHGGRRNPVHVKARAEAMAIVRRELGFSYPQIGRAFGGFHHTSVMFLVKSVGEIEWAPARTLTREQLTARCEELEERLRNIESILSAKDREKLIAITNLTESLTIRDNSIQ